MTKTSDLGLNVARVFLYLIPPAAERIFSDDG